MEMQKQKAALGDRAGWKALESHAATMKNTQMKDLFSADAGRGTRYTAEADGIFLDYSKNRVSDETLKLLFALADEAGVAAKRDAMFTGEKINVTEGRAVLHVALRAPKTEKIILDGEDVVAPVHEVLEKMSGFAAKIRSGEWKGFTGKPIKNVVNIGIGGSGSGAGHGVRSASLLLAA